MINLGEYTPESESAGGRDPATGRAVISRPLTTTEQWIEVLEWMLAGAEEHKENGEVRALVKWAHVEPTIVIAGVSLQHVSGRPVRFLIDVTERTVKGADIPADSEARMRQLGVEVGKMQQAGLL